MSSSRSSIRRRSLSITPLSILPTRQSSLNLLDQVIQTGPPPLISAAALLDEQQQQQRLDEVQRARLEQFLQARDEIHSLLPEHFDVLELLGYGSGGCVNKVLHKPTGIVMARKTIQLTVKPAARNQIIQELKILHECNSPRIVGFYGGYYWQGEINLCMEHMNGGSLDKIYRKVVRIPERILSVITGAVLEGLAYLKEQHRVIHRDIKPSNILVNSNGEIKLCDFGVSGLLINSMAESFVGSRSYMSPERLEGVHYSIASDIWSLGLSLVELATGRYPIPQLEEDEEREWMLHDRLPAELDSENNQNGTYAGGVSAFDLLAFIQNDPPPTVLAEFFTPDFKNFVDACLMKEPAKRPDLHALQKHPFVTANETGANAGNISEWLKFALAAKSEESEV